MKFIVLYNSNSHMSQLHVLEFFVFNFAHQLSSTASLSLSELSSAVKFFKIWLLQ